VSWARLDDSYSEHPKVLRAWQRDARAVGLHAQAIAYAARYGTDGRIPYEWLEQKIPSAAHRRRALQVLVDTGLFDVDERGNVFIHDFLDYNGSSEERSAQISRARSEAGRRGAAARWQRDPEPSEPMANANSKPMANANGKTERQNAPDPTRPLNSNSHVEPGLDETEDSRRAGVVDRVFAAWRQATGKTARTRLDPKRRRTIANAAKTYPEQDLIDAVRGWRHSPHHRGENPQRMVYNDITLLLRDAEHIERFRDLERAHRRSDGEPRRTRGLAWLEEGGATA
jgi:hypothetical protein